MPGLIIHAIEKGTNKALVAWAKEIVDKGFKTVNMLGCHDGIPLLDLKGKEVKGIFQKGLLEDEEIKETMSLILERGGRVKNLYGADGKKVSYNQMNATYYSALGEDDQKMLLASAIQLFMPGTPQIWYLDIFAGTNDYEAVENAGKDGHKEINRSNLSLEQISTGLEKEVVKGQLALIKPRNTSAAFGGTILIQDSPKNELNILWENTNEMAQLIANLETHAFRIDYMHEGQKKTMSF